VLANVPHEVTAEAIEPCQVKTIRKQEFVDFLGRHGIASMHAAQSLSGEYLNVFHDAKRLALSGSAAGRLARIRSARPLVDAGPVTPSMQLGTRNRQVDEVSWGAASVMNAIGTCPFNTAARYMRGRITVPAGQSWDHIIGIDDVDAAPAGRQ